VRLETDGSEEAIPLQRTTMRHRRWPVAQCRAPAALFTRRTDLKGTEAEYHAWSSVWVLLRTPTHPAQFKRLSRAPFEFGEETDLIRIGQARKELAELSPRGM
jgi:hypothetical protein